MSFEKKLYVTVIISKLPQQISNKDLSKCGVDVKFINEPVMVKVDFPNSDSNKVVGHPQCKSVDGGQFASGVGVGPTDTLAILRWLVDVMENEEAKGDLDIPRERR